MKINSLKKTIKYLLFSVAFTPLVVSYSFLYPFVTPRASFFYFVVEAAFLLFLVLLFFGKIEKINLRGNWLTIAVGSFVIVSIISAFFGESPYTSFFSTIERWWGVLTIIHIFLFYFLLRSFFEKKDWLVFFRISLIVSLAVSFVAFTQKFTGFFVPEANQISGTLGNSTYFAIYLVFNIFFALYLFLKEKETKFDFKYLLPVFVYLAAFSMTGTRGAYLGVILALVVILFSYIFLGESKRYKKISASLLVFFVLGLSLVFFAPESKLVKSVPVFERISSISLSGGTAATRLISWQAALKGFSENPILGVGPENYNIVFNKYFQSDYYLYAPTEPYFDRAHNKFLDILATLGILGLAAYLAIIFFIFFIIFKLYKNKKIKLSELLLFSAVPIIYFVHLFFVFDDLNSFILFFVFLGFLEFLFKEERLCVVDENSKNPEAFKRALAVVLLILILFSAYEYNLKVAYAAKLENDAKTSQNSLEAIKYFDKALDINSNPQKDIVYGVVDFLYLLSPNYEKIKENTELDERFKKILQKSKIALDKEIKKDPKDALLYIKKANLNSIFYVVYNDDIYVNDAVGDIKKALSLSEDRPQYYHFLANIYLLSNNSKKAVESAEFALDMNKGYGASYFVLAKAYAADGRLNDSLKYLKEASERDFNIPKNTALFIAKKFLDANELKSASEVYNIFLKTGKNPSSEVFLKLAIIYLELNEPKKAIESAEKAAELDENLKSTVAVFVAEVKKGNLKELLEQLR